MPRPEPFEVGDRAMTLREKLQKEGLSDEEVSENLTRAYAVFSSAPSLRLSGFKPLKKKVSC